MDFGSPEGWLWRGAGRPRVARTSCTPTGIAPERATTVMFSPVAMCDVLEEAHGHFAKCPTCVFAIAARVDEWANWGRDS